MSIRKAASRASDTVGRRAFVRSTLASVFPALPASRLWADAASPGAIPDTIAAVSLSGKPISLMAADIQDLHAGLAGQLFLRTNAGCDRARKIWNDALDRHPAPVAH